MSRFEKHNKRIGVVFLLAIGLIMILLAMGGFWQTKSTSSDATDRWANALCENMKANRQTERCLLTRHGSVTVNDTKIQFVIFETFYSAEVAEEQGMGTHRYSPWTLYIQNDRVVDAQ